jgi:hypothetical protein
MRESMLNKIKKKEKAEKIITRKQVALDIEFQDGSIQTIKVNERIISAMKAKKSNFLIDKAGQNLTISKDFFSHDLYVPNVYRYTLKKSDGSFTLFFFQEKNASLNESQFHDRRITEETDIPTIALILESPHQDEYKYSDDNLTPIAPAQGITGKMIFAKLDELLNKSNYLDLFDKDEYRVIIVNPIPVQTSLVFLHDSALSGVYITLRNKIWICLWDNGNFKAEFSFVLDEIKAEIVLNCCTKDLTSFVSSTIASEKEVIELHHPSSWWRNNDQIRIKKRT